VVLYHSVATLYLALLLAVVTVVGLPYLLLYRGRSGAHGEGGTGRRAEVRAGRRADVGGEVPAGARDEVPVGGREEVPAGAREEVPAGGREERRADGRAEARRLAGSLTLALAGLGVLSVAYAAYTYLLGKSGTGSSATSTAVSIAVGSQPVLSVTNVLSALSSSVVWLGGFGLAAGPGRCSPR